MPQATQPTPEQRAQFQQAAEEVAKKIVQALDGPQNTFVVLEGLVMVHRWTALQAPPDAIGQISMAMAAYAGELLQHSSALSNPVTPGGSAAVH